MSPELYWAMAVASAALLLVCALTAVALLLELLRHP